MKVYRKLLTYVPEFRIYAFLAAVFSALSAVFTVYGYYYIFRFLENLVIYDDLNQSSSYAVKTAVLLTLGSMIYFISGIFSHKLGFRLETNLRKKGIDGLSKAGFRFFDINSSGEIRKCIDDNAAQTHQAVAHLIPDSSQAFLVPVLSIILGFFVDVKVGITVLFTVSFCMIILKLMMGEGEFMKIYQRALEILSAQAVEYVRGIQVVKIFGASVESFNALDKAIKDYSKYAYEYSQSCKKPYVRFQFLFFGIIAIIIIPIAYFLPYFYDYKRLVVSLIMIMFLTGILFVSCMRIMWVSMYIFQAKYAVETLEKMYESMSDEAFVFGSEEKFKNYDIEFKNVSFSYGDKKVFENLSLKLDQKKIYALVGSSGGGKSTIAKLISGFYRVDSGEITIGSKSLEKYSKEALTKAVSFVFQDSRLFKKSIYENVKDGNKDASEKEVFEAMSLAGCDEIIEKLKDREKTVIGSRGVYLSGGEIQRIAIARAILKDSPIIIMDEASAAIDPENEYQMQKAFKNLMKGKTVIMIAHRLSSIKNADEIIVVEGGEIVEKGSYDDLMKKNGRYRKLQDIYDSANEWRVADETVL